MERVFVLSFFGGPLYGNMIHGVYQSLELATNAGTRIATHQNLIPVDPKIICPLQRVGEDVEKIIKYAWSIKENREHPFLVVFETHFIRSTCEDIYIQAKSEMLQAQREREREREIFDSCIKMGPEMGKKWFTFWLGLYNTKPNTQQDNKKEIKEGQVYVDAEYGDTAMKIIKIHDNDYLHIRLRNIGDKKNHKGLLPMTMYDLEITKSEILEGIKWILSNSSIWKD